jgi:hypothetical protein
MVAANMQRQRGKKVLFLHGMESGPKGRKAQYLRINYPNEVSVPDLRPWWLLPLAFCRALRAYRRCRPELVVASSMGAILCSVLMFFGVVQCAVILLAPPFPNILWFLWARHLASGRSLILVHGASDPMSNFAVSMRHTHRNLRQLVLNDGHALRSLLADGGLLTLVSGALPSRNERMTQSQSSVIGVRCCAFAQKKSML